MSEVGEGLGGSSELAAGTRFGPYRIEAEIGRGGMSIVYRAVEDSLSRTVALKIMASHLQRDANYRQRFHVEARAAAAINHPNIVPIYAFGEQDARLYIAMQHVEGSDLRHHLRAAGRLDPPAAVTLLEQVASALDAIHARGLTHRDIKPDNILLGAPRPDGTPHVYVSDFGLTRAEGDAHLTSTGQILGTVTYAAPEQLLGEHVDGRADVYALACVLFEATVGRPPFDKPVAAALIYAHVHEQPPQASELRNDLPPMVDQVLATGMAKDRNQRYQSAGELIAAFRSASVTWEPTGSADAPTATAPLPKPRWLPAPSAPLASPAPASTGTRTSQDHSGPPGAPSVSVEPVARPEADLRDGAPAKTRRGCTVTISIGAAILVLVLVGATLATVGKRRGGDVASAPPSSTTTRSTAVGSPPSSTQRRPTTTDRPPASVPTGESLAPILEQIRVVLGESRKARTRSEEAVDGVRDACRVSPSDASGALAEAMASREAQIEELTKIDTSQSTEGSSLVSSLTQILTQSNKADQAYKQWLDDAVAAHRGATPPGCPGGSVPEDLAYARAVAAAAGVPGLRPLFVATFNVHALRARVEPISTDSF